MNTKLPALLVLNGGSSSLRFALLQADSALTPLCHGKVERIGQADAHLALRATSPASASSSAQTVPITAPDHATAIDVTHGEDMPEVREWTWEAG